MPLHLAPALADQVQAALQAEICDGVLPAGTHLVQDQLAQRLGVSRQPVQQALARLKAEGLVEEIGTRGLRVAVLDLGLLRHHGDILAALDGLAARLAAQRVAAEPLLAGPLSARGAAVMLAGEAALAAGRIAEQLRQDEAFHRMIHAASGNPLLAGTAEPSWRFLRRAASEVLREQGMPGAIWVQHQAILEAVLRSDPDEAEAQAIGHALRTAAVLTAAAGGG